MSVRETTGDKFSEVMAMPAGEVFTLLTYMRDKVEVIKLKGNGTN